jgi:sporulation protein YlmC with PRC-barrel domain
MSMKTIALALALGTTLAAPAIAQDNTTQKPKDTQAQSMKAAPSGDFMTQAKQGQYRASKFIGVNIYNNSDENVGEVNEVLVDKDGMIQAVVIGVGGFLGIGEKDVALPFKSINWVDQPRPAAAAANPPANTGTGAATMGANNTAAPAPAPVPAAPATDTTGTVAAADANVARDYPDHGMINMSKDQLQNAPEFKYYSETK